MTDNKRWIRPGFICIIAVMCYVIIQAIYSVSYVLALRATISGVVEISVGILRFALIFAPIVVFIFSRGLQNSKKIFLESVKAHWFFYLLYIVVLYLIKSSIVLGDYFIEISMLNMYFELSKNAFSDFVMAFAYTVFDSTAATLFFILLPVYFLVFSRRKDL